MNSRNSVEAKALEALERLVRQSPTNEQLKAKLAAGHRIITPTSVAAEAGVNRGPFGSRGARLGHVWEQIKQAADEEKRTSFADELERVRAENTRLRALLNKVHLHNASLQLALTRLQKRKAHVEVDTNVVNFRQNHRRRPR